MANVEPNLITESYISNYNNNNYPNSIGINQSFDNNIYQSGRKNKNIIRTTTTLIICTLITMLISCQFKYGILVIGSESMTGTINIGDTIIYEQYKNQTIKKGDIIIFNNSGIKTIHLEKIS